MNQIDSPSKDNPELKESCPKCGKVKSSSEKFTFTSWIFRTGNCSCSPEKVEKKNRSEPTKKERGEDLKAPEIENYDVVDFIGQGGMGSVYKVTGKSVEGNLAVKVLRPEFVPDHIAVKRFEQEAIAASKLTHPNLVQVFGHGTTSDGSPYLVMEYLEGESLGEYFDRVGKIAPEVVLDIFIQVCGALSHAHNKGVIHRDLTPGNIILTFAEDGSVTARVVDFGIAKIQHDMRSTQDLTETGSVLGSPSYMSPEQCLGLNIDSRTDIYSIGCVLYEALTGEELFSGENPVQVIAKHLEETPDKIYNSRDIPRKLENVISTCLEREINNRYQSTVELGIDLQRIKDGKEPEFCLLSEDRFDKWTKKKPVLYSILSMAAFVCLCVIVSCFPQLELFNILRFCLMIISVLFFGISISKIIKTVLSCTIRTVRLIDLVSISFFGSLLGNCFVLLVYSLANLTNISLNGYGFIDKIVPGVILTGLLAIVLAFVQNHSSRNIELVKGRFDNRTSRCITSIVASSAMLFSGYFLIQGSFNIAAKFYNPMELEANWEREKEISYLSRLIDVHTEKSFSKNSRIGDQYRYIRALHYFTIGRIDECLSDLDIVIQGEGPAKDAAMIERSIIYWCQGKDDLASEQANLVYEHDPKNKGAMFLNGFLALGAFDVRRANKFLKLAGKNRSSSTTAVLISFAERLNGNEQEAKRIIASYLRNHKNDRLTSYLSGKMSFKELVQGLPEDNKCNIKAIVGWDLMLDGKVEKSNKLFKEVIDYVDKNGLKWTHGMYYGLAKSGLEHNQSQALKKESA